MARKLSALIAAAMPLAFSAAALAEGGHGGEGEQTELIQLNWPTAIWTIIVFVIMLIVLYPTAWKSVLAGLKAREERIRKEIADAETARAHAEETLAKYNAQLAAAEERVRDMITKAIADGERMAATIRQNATQEGEGIRARTAADIEAAKKQAIGEIHAVAADLATSVAAKIIRKNLSPADQRELVQASLDELQAQSRN